VAVAVFAQQAHWPAEWRLFVITGFLGGLTTFSTFSAEVVALLQQGRAGAAGALVALHLAGPAGGHRGGLCHRAGRHRGGFALKALAPPVIPWLEDDTPLPPTLGALPAGSEAPGLVAAGGGLHPARLEEAYRRRRLPLVRPGAARAVVEPRSAHGAARWPSFRLSRSLRKTMRRFRRTPGCEVRVDHDLRARHRAPAR
jgi:hypothetical protein